MDDAEARDVAGVLTAAGERPATADPVAAIDPAGLVEREGGAGNDRCRVAEQHERFLLGHGTPEHARAAQDHQAPTERAVDAGRGLDDLVQADRTHLGAAERTRCEKPQQASVDHCLRDEGGQRSSGLAVRDLFPNERRQSTQGLQR